MRNLMICASALLAMFQVWPMVFGHHSGPAPAQATAPRVVAAVATDTELPHIIPVSTAPVAAPKSCYSQYQAHFAACRAGDQACHVKSADDWDLCEATGFWPE